MKPLPQITAADVLFVVDRGESALSDLASDDLPTVASAYHAIGLNVTLQPLGAKGGWPWKQSQTVRLSERDLIDLIALAGECNLAVMTGRTSDNLFILDCETPEALAQQCNELTRRAIPLWVSTSNSAKGGGHIWLRCREGEIGNIAKLPGMEIRGNRNFILVPPSIHPDGTLYTWIAQQSVEIPAVALVDLDWLPLLLQSPKRSTKAPAVYSPYSAATQEFIERGAPVSTRNRRLFAAACDVIGCGDDPEDVLRGPARQCGLSDREIASTLHSAAKHERQPAKQRAVAQPCSWQHAVAWSERQSWRGRTGPTDKAVWLALCERSRLGEINGVFRAAEREVAELARIGRVAARKAIKRFEKRAVLQAVGPDVFGARRFKFAGDVLDTPVQPNVQLATIEKCDLAERGRSGNAGFGMTAFTVYRHLLRYGTKTVRELQHGCTLSERQVRNALRRLCEIGVQTGTWIVKVQDRSTNLTWIVDSGSNLSVPRQAQRWHANKLTAAELDRLAGQLGVADKADKRKQKHVAERSTRAYKLLETAITKPRRKARS